MFTDAKIIAHDIDPEVYHRRDPNIPRGHRDYVMSRSELMEFWTCPRRWIRGVPETRSRSTDFGSLLDCALLQPEKFSARYIVQPATYPAGTKHEKVRSGEISVGDPLPWNANATHCKEWIESVKNKGVKPVSYDENESSNTAVNRLLNDPEIAALLKGSKRQVYITATWQIPARNPDRNPNLRIPIKTLLDIEADPSGPFADTIADLKTVRDAHPSRWSKVCCEYDYDVQAALYSDIYKAATGVEPDFRHILVENHPPFEIGRRLMSCEFLNVGREIYTTALAAYEQCLQTDTWPGYDDAPTNLVHGWSLTSPPEWRLKSIYPENA